MPKDAQSDLSIDLQNSFDLLRDYLIEFAENDRRDWKQQISGTLNSFIGQLLTDL